MTVDLDAEVLFVSDERAGRDPPSARATLCTLSERTSRAGTRRSRSARVSRRAIEDRQCARLLEALDMALDLALVPQHVHVDHGHVSALVLLTTTIVSRKVQPEVPCSDAISIRSMVPPLCSNAHLTEPPPPPARLMGKAFKVGLENLVASRTNRSTR